MQEIFLAVSAVAVIICLVSMTVMSAVWAVEFTVGTYVNIKRMLREKE